MPSNIVERILKLFRLGSTSANTTEAETLAAITKAKELMAKHDIDAYTVQTALDASTQTAGRQRIRVDQYTAYTRKIRNLARYDGIVAMCVGKLTQTEPLISNRRTLNGWYTSLLFVGTEADASVAQALFTIFLPEVRRAARKVYGSTLWDKQHTSYAIGYAVRMLDRAKTMVTTLTPEESQTMALIVQDKSSAISAYMKAEVIHTTPKDKKMKIDPWAYAQGYRDGDGINLDKQGVKA
jgi:hypothetical protein